MRLLVICPHFAPDTAPTGTVMTRIVQEMARMGHEIHVVTSLPWYRDHRIDPAWQGAPAQRQHTHWGSVTRLHPMAGADKANVVRRAVSFGGFSVFAGAAALFHRDGPFHGVLAMSPPLTLFMSGWLAARPRRIPLVANIQDVFPDVAIELGVIRGRNSIRFFRALERVTYRCVDAVTVLSDDLKASVAPRTGDPAKVRVIPNFVDTVAISPLSGSPYRDELGVGDRTVVMYAGNIGFSQPFETVLEAARRLEYRTDVVFVINGQGVARPHVERLASGRSNVVLGDFQPEARLPEVLAAGDIHLVPLKRGLAASSVPSKSYSILAAGRPVVTSVDPGTEIERVVERAGAGLATPPEDATALADALLELVDDPDTRRRMGASGRDFVESWASPAAVATAYTELFEELRERRSPPP